MQKKIMAVAVALITALTILAGAMTPFRAGAVTMEEMTNVAVEIITANEGSYGSVNANDNGAVSLGILQWHANRALSLMRSIASADTDSALSLLGTDFYQDVMSSSSWSSRTFSSTEKSAASALLTTSAGINTQDALAYSDVQGYIQAGQNYGITDPAVLVYFAEVYNRGSAIAARVVASAKGSGSYSEITLDAIHAAALSDSSNSSGMYTYRLTYAYNTLVALNWSTVTVTDNSEANNTPAEEDEYTDESGAESDEETDVSDADNEEDAITEDDFLADDEANVDSGDEMPSCGISATSTVVASDEEETQTETTAVTVAEPTDDFTTDYAGDYIVNASSLNIRSAPTTSSDKIGVAYNGETLTVLCANGAWAQIVYGIGTGYCSMDYLIAVDDTQLDTSEADLYASDDEEETQTEPLEDENEETEDESEDVSAEYAQMDEEIIEDEPPESEPESESESEEEESEPETYSPLVQLPEEVETVGVSDPLYASVYGDVSGDGKVTLVDAILLQRYLDGYTLLDAQQLANADVHRDNILNRADVNVIMGFAAQSVTALPIV